MCLKEFSEILRRDKMIVLIPNKEIVTNLLMEKLLVLKFQCLQMYLTPTMNALNFH